MTHDATIPHDLHTELRPAVTDALGSFWSSVFGDRDLLDALIASRTLSASQAYVDAMEALGLRDHRTLPVYHREHWHPLLIRLSDRNEGRGLVLGMDSAVIGGQRDRGGNPTPYKVGEVFKVGANAELSKVYTYPFESMAGCPLVRVGTGLFDSISNPSHILVQGRDFALGSGVLTIRKEEDPFEVGGYRVLEVEDDRVAVLWVCDGEYDTNNVGDFLAYPMGFDAESSGVTKRILSAYWDAVLYGLAPRYLNAVLGALYDVPTAEADETVERVTEVDGTWTDVVTPTRVYRVETARRRPSVKAGTDLRTGDFLTDELTVYHSLSEDEFNGLVDRGAITRIVLPPGSVADVDAETAVEDIESEPHGWWFQMNAGDGADSPFWTAARERATEAELADAVGRLVRGGTVNPLRTVGYAALANTVIVSTGGRRLAGTPLAPQVFRALQRLMPGYASLLTVDEVTGA